MASESGTNPAKQQENRNESSSLTLPTGEQVTSVPLVIGSFSIDDAIAMHLVDCAECRAAIQTLKPKAIGQKTGLCDEYLQLQLVRAQYEGARNNVVAYTEFGDEAPKSRELG